jgi:cellobiose phosphorylase
MCLASQVFPVISGVADEKQVKQIIKSVNKHLLDKKLKGYHLNTDFKAEQHDLGRAFSFAYGDKENGAIFSHMVVMYAYALYSRGFAKEGWKALSSLYALAKDAEKSKIYPCLPEYFDAQGRGMYSYLTGSASWFTLTILTQVFGVYGRGGELIIEPKLVKEQFRSSPKISITRDFSGRSLMINFINPRKLEYGKYKIIGLKINSARLDVDKESRLVISRKIILSLPVNKINTIDVILSEAEGEAKNLF